METLDEGLMEDAAAQVLRSCDPESPLTVHVAKMVPTSDNGRFYACGRVFSGTIATRACKKEAMTETVVAQACCFEPQGSIFS